MAKQLWVGVVLVLMLVVPGAALADEVPASGRYQASIEGVTIDIELHKNGTATVEGERSKWIQLPGQLVLPMPAAPVWSPPTTVRVFL